MGGSTELTHPFFVDRNAKAGSCKKRKDGAHRIPFWEEKSKPLKGPATRLTMTSGFSPCIGIPCEDHYNSVANQRRKMLG